MASLRAIAVLTLALAAAMSSSPASAQDYECVNEPALSLADPNDDGLLTLEELQAIAAQFPTNQQLQDLVTRAAASGLVGIDYDGTCDTPAEASPDASTASGAPESTVEDVKVLPATGQGTVAGGSDLTMPLGLGMLGLVTLGAAIALRQRRST